MFGLFISEVILNGNKSSKFLGFLVLFVCWTTGCLVATNFQNFIFAWDLMKMRLVALWICGSNLHGTFVLFVTWFEFGVFEVFSKNMMVF